MVEFRFGAVVLIEKLVFNVAYEKIGVAGPHFGTHGHTIIFDLFIITVAKSYYKQINGVAMGTKMEPSYANLFVGYIEHQFLQLYLLLYLF